MYLKYTTMTLKTFFFIFAVLASPFANAQDKIYKKDGTVIDAIIKEVGDKTINYKRFDNPNGPDYTILKKNSLRIVYQDGTFDNFDGNGKTASTPKIEKEGNNTPLVKRFGDNILTFIPGSYTMCTSINDPGIGICYERLLDNKGHFSLVLPVTLNFSQKKDFNTNLYYYNNYLNSSVNYYSYLLMPGVKIYPLNSSYKVRHALGASFFVISGTEPYWSYDYTASPASSDKWRYTMYGMVLSNSVNVSVTRNFYMELDMNIGLPFSDNRISDHASVDITGPLLQFALKAGGRF